jgi:hypothetical protein
MHLIRRILGTTAVVVGLAAIVAGPVAPTAEAGELVPCKSYTRWDNLGGSNHYTAWYPTTSYWSWNTDDCELSEDDTGSGVRVLQQALNRCYGAGLKVDSDFGPKTGDAMYRVWMEETGMRGSYYNEIIRVRMEWPYWWYDDRGRRHARCIDNGD